MTSHKWTKEIKAWADGFEIQRLFNLPNKKIWIDEPRPDFNLEGEIYRIKPDQEFILTNILHIHISNRKHIWEK